MTALPAALQCLSVCKGVWHKLNLPTKGNAVHFLYRKSLLIYATFLPLASGCLAPWLSSCLILCYFSTGLFFASLLSVGCLAAHLSAVILHKL